MTSLLKDYQIFIEELAATPIHKKMPKSLQKAWILAPLSTDFMHIQAKKAILELEGFKNHSLALKNWITKQLDQYE